MPVPPIPPPIPLNHCADCCPSDMDNHRPELRDLFAAHALQGMMASGQVPFPTADANADIDEQYQDCSLDQRKVADVAYQWADALIKAR